MKEQCLFSYWLLCIEKWIDIFPKMSNSSFNAVVILTCSSFADNTTATGHAVHKFPRSFICCCHDGTVGLRLLCRIQGLRHPVRVSQSWAILPGHRHTWEQNKRTIRGKKEGLSHNTNVSHNVLLYDAESKISDSYEWQRTDRIIMKSHVFRIKWLSMTKSLKS